MSNVVSFYPQVPESIVVNRNWSCRPSEPENAWKKPYLIQPATVESVKDALVRGPFVAMAAVGPSCYSTKPTQFDKLIPGHHNVPVYGWKATAERISEQSVPIIVCGVQRRDMKEHLYFVLAQDVSQNPQEAIGKFVPLSTDKKVYAVSITTYARFEFDMFPPVSDEEVERYEGQQVVPTLLAGKPDLIAAWKQGKIKISTMGLKQ